MCEEEYAETVKYGKAQFLRKFKWFSPSLDFVKGRVLDGKFGNSCFVPGKYVRILSFEAEIEKADWIKGNEVQFSVRRNAQIILIGEVA